MSQPASRITLTQEGGGNTNYTVGSGNPQQPPQRLPTPLRSDSLSRKNPIGKFSVKPSFTSTPFNPESQEHEQEFEELRQENRSLRKELEKTKREFAHFKMQTYAE